MFNTATVALFGEDYAARALPLNMMRHFSDDDSIFQLLVSELIPTSLFNRIPMLKHGFKGEKAVMDTVYDWINEAAPGLEKGDVIKILVEICKEAKISARDTATFLFGDLWDLQQNAP